MTVEDAYSELGRILLDRTRLPGVMQRVVELARDTIPGVDEASVTLVEGQRARSVSFTGSLAAQLDERQYELGFGPCMDAAMTGQVVRVTDTSLEGGPYSGYTQVARRAGVRSTLSIGLAVPAKVVGALNLYDTVGEGFDDVTLKEAQTFAGYAAIALTNSLVVESTRELAEQLQLAMATRAVIEQAKGVVAARRAINPEEAFALMSRRSQDTNRKLSLLAADVVASAEGGSDLGW